jgi:TPP-dependent pyruvate/acetoin dehydrogenase alpha subunit
MTQDPILILKKTLILKKMLTEAAFEEMEKKARKIAIDAMQFAEQSPDPNPIVLEEGVFAPPEKGNV